MTLLERGTVLGGRAGRWSEAGFTFGAPLDLSAVRPEADASVQIRCDPCGRCGRRGRDRWRRRRP
ncbi:hypothetical protein ABZV25_12435 [Micrococcus luteus]